MRTVNEVSRLSGISIRALHHYDAIGLLRPTTVTEAGYRLYDDAAIDRLQSILLFRELQFSLKEIKEILDSPGFDAAKALDQQIELLELEQKRIEKLISLAREVRKKGEVYMGFGAFDKSEIKTYKAEAKTRWGNTKQYKEFEERNSGGTPNSGDALMDIFARLGALRYKEPGDASVQEKIAEIQKFISDNYYTCTKEILSSLGQMYTCDDRFKQNIDNAGGNGTADFAGKAIKIYCSNK